jgi:TatA/E family protein of Tat protein translocase
MFLREPSHILILLIVVAVLFGAKRLPDSARSLGRSMRIFKSEMKEMKNDEPENKSKNEDSSEK